jgi:hypothetical protein
MLVGWLVDRNREEPAVAKVDRDKQHRPLIVHSIEYHLTVSDIFVETAETSRRGGESNRPPLGIWMFLIVRFNSGLLRNTQQLHCVGCQTQML